MKNEQACGYILEYVIGELLKESGYINIEEGNIRGRGADHQIDAYGICTFPNAFVYPIRLISEVKCYSRGKIGLPKIRNFVGVIKDISENYGINGIGEKSIRYTDCGCFFSSVDFTKDAQKYAWAQNIFLVSFCKIEKMDEIIKNIRDFVESLRGENSIQGEIDLNKNKLIEAFKNRDSRSTGINEISESMNRTSLKIGILDNLYPVILVGEKNWDEKIKIPKDSDKISVKKVGRHDSDDSSNFKLDIENTTVTFNVPKNVSNILRSRIRKTSSRKPIFSIDIPVLMKCKKEDGDPVRRILKLEVKL